MAMTENTMTIREMCNAYEVTPRTLRFYETKELLAPIRVGQKRLFTDRDRARLKLILRGKRFGFSLEEIRQILDLYDRDDDRYSQTVRAIELGRERHSALLKEREDLNAAIAELEEQLRWGARMIEEMSGDQRVAS
jgi:DNA-binding transcriptional MerR regulator